MMLASHWIVTGAVSIAGRFGISEFVIGLTVVAVGTSLPEIATTVAAVRQRQYDLAVGNVLGSCFFNIAAVPTTMALMSSHALAVANEALWVDIPIMIFALIACLPVFLSGHRISRFEGVLFLAYYLAYVVLLYFRGSPGSVLSQYKVELGLLALPIVTMTIAILVVRAIKERRQSHGGVAQ